MSLQCYLERNELHTTRFLWPDVAKYSRSSELSFNPIKLIALIPKKNLTQFHFQNEINPKNALKKGQIKFE